MLLQQVLRLIPRNALLPVKLGNIICLGIYGKKRKNQVRVADLCASQTLSTLSKNLQNAKWSDFSQLQPWSPYNHFEELYPHQHLFVSVLRHISHCNITASMKFNPSYGVVFLSNYQEDEIMLLYILHWTVIVVAFHILAIKTPMHGNRS